MERFVLMHEPPRTFSLQECFVTGVRGGSTGPNVLYLLCYRGKGVSGDVVFGGVSILAVGDLYQLPPVGQAPLFSTVSDCYAQL